MNRKIIWLIAILSSIAFSSCINLLDEIKLNSDKSGSFFIGLESKMLASILNMAKDQIPKDLSDDINKFPSEAKKRIEGINTISNIKTLDEMGDGRLGISFDFSNPKSLNKAYYALLEIEKTWYLPNILKIGKHKVKRRNLTPQLVKQIEKNNPELKDSDLLKYLHWETVIKLPSNSKSITSEYSKSKVGSEDIVIRYSLTEIIKEEKSTAFGIRF